MSNLIITIISIGLFAIAAIAGAYYGGAAYQSAQIDVIATTIISEAQQILAAERLWTSNNNQPDISGMPSSTVSNGITYLGNANTGMSLLVSSKMLTAWPPFAGTLGGPIYTLPGNAPAAGPSPQPTGNVATSAYDDGCYNINGLTGRLKRLLFASKGGNYVYYSFGFNNPVNSLSCSFTNANFSTSTTDASQANHPIVRITKSINAKLNQIASNADLSIMPYLGLPKAPIGSVDQAGGNGYYWDSNGTMQSNYCYLVSGALIACVFGPS